MGSDNRVNADGNKAVERVIDDAKDRRKNCWNILLNMSFSVQMD